MLTTESTTFTRDVIGRYVCNTFSEAEDSANSAIRADARPFDVVIIGGGSFGSVIAQHVFFADKTHSHRILVLEAGSFLLTEHFQNLPMIGLSVPGPTTVDPGKERAEVWGLPWRSDDPFGFPGLAYCIGGRSLYFGGWSPQLLDTPTDTEMPTSAWPAGVVGDLNTRYFGEAARQIGTDTVNDFIDGPMHRALRKQLFDGITANKVTDAIPLAELPLHLNVPPGTLPATLPQLKLEAPLAVQSRTEPGLFPINKFSSVPLLIQAARTASNDSTAGVGFPDDVKKRLMVVPQFHVSRLTTVVTGGMGHVTEVQGLVYTGFGTPGGVHPVPKTYSLADDANVIVALGTIESARLALLSFEGITNYDQIGKGLRGHLRSNLTIRVPRTAITALSPTVKALQASALFVKGRHTTASGTGHFHLQITAAGLDRPGGDSEAELFKKIPDLDHLDAMLRATDNTIVITIRAIGEMRNPANHVALAFDKPVDEASVHRAQVTLEANAEDNLLWGAMDQASDQVAKVFAGTSNFEVLTATGFVAATPATDLAAVMPYTYMANGGRRDGLGTTHHEAGSLRMGTSPASSATDANGRFHFVNNAYVAGPALFPTVGSPNPMLTGVALARRLADRLAATPPVTADPGFTLLFDGSNTDKWRMSTIKNQPGHDNPGTFIVAGAALESIPGNDLGLYWHTDPTPADFILKLEWLRWREDDNSGVFIRFPNPNSKGYNNTAYVAIDFGFEVQIDQLARDDGAPIHKTGAIYGFQGPQNPDSLPVNAPGQWNEFEIHAQGQTYTVFLNGTQITQYVNPDAGRGLPSAGGAPSFIGLQTHTGRVAFRKIQIKAI